MRERTVTHMSQNGHINRFCEEREYSALRHTSVVKHLHEVRQMESGTDQAKESIAKYERQGTEGAQTGRHLRLQIGRFGVSFWDNLRPYGPLRYIVKRVFWFFQFTRRDVMPDLNSRGLKITLIWLLVPLACLPTFAQNRELPITPPNPTQRDLGTPEFSPEQEELNALVRKYTSDAKLGSAGRIQLIWLNPELIDALIDDFGHKGNLTIGQIDSLKAQLKIRLKISESLAFLAIFRPSNNCFISPPYWGVYDGHGYPQVLLRGSRGLREPPYKWGQILGDGDFHWYSDVVWSYLLFKARSPNGQPVVDGDDFSFSVELRDAAEMQDESLYDASSQFHYDLMPVQLQSIVDASIPTWNNSLVEMHQQRNGKINRTDVGDPAEGYDRDGRLYASQSNSVSLSRSDTIQILGLALQFAQFLLK